MKPSGGGQQRGPNPGQQRRPREAVFRRPSYTVDKFPNKPDLWLAKRIGGKWIIELVDTDEIAGHYNSIVVDQQSNIYISYSAMTRLKMATNINGIWNFELIDPKGTITYTSLSIDAYGMPHIAYYDKDTGVKYAYKIRAN